MIKIIAGKYTYTYVLKEEDKQVRYEITYKDYFRYGSMCNIDKYIKDLLECEMNKLKKYECRNLHE
jgi:hypothetical protein